MASYRELGLFARLFVLVEQHEPDGRTLASNIAVPLAKKWTAFKFGRMREQEAPEQPHIRPIDSKPRKPRAMYRHSI